MYRSGPDKRIALMKSKKSALSQKQAAREILVLAASAALSPEAREAISSLLKHDVDWQHLLDLADYHGVGPLVSHNLLRDDDFAGRVPRPYAEKLNAVYHNSLYKNILFTEELSKVLAALNENNVPAIVLKGVILSELLYNNPGLRAMSDIDIMVPADLMRRAKSLISGLGYRPDTGKEPWEHPFHEVPYYKRAQVPVFIELHRNLDDPGLVDIPLQDIWRRAQEVRMQGLTSLLLSPEDTLLHLSNSFSKPSDYKLKTLADITELLKKYEGLLDWDYVLESARTWRVHIVLGCALEYARSLLGAPVPEAVTKALRPGFWRSLAQKILTGRGKFISPIRWSKLRNETLVLRKSLMMDRPGQMAIVFSRFRGRRSGVAWFKSAVWILFVFFTALGRYLMRPGDGKMQHKLSRI
jgi:hypothetical protein